MKKQISLKLIFYPILVIVLMWLVFFLQQFNLFSNCWGAIIPLVPSGLKGVLISPLLHANLDHLIANTVPMFALTLLLFHFYTQIAKTILLIGWVSTGFLVWLLPPIDVFSANYIYSCIIGASGVVYFLAFFIFFSGIFRGEKKLLTVSLLVAFLYGSMIWGILPEELFFGKEYKSNVSWQSHLSGAILGFFMAFYNRKKGEKKRKFIWEYPNYYSEKDDELWNGYKENHPEDFLEMPKKKDDDIWKFLDEIRNQHDKKS